MRPPGDLNDLGADGRAAWDRLIASEVNSILKELKEAGKVPTGLASDDTNSAGVRTIEWPGFPVLVSDELGLDAALELLDLPFGAPDGGRLRQEEYLEWRPIIRDGRLRGIEMTTELRDYWTVLAGHEPGRTLELLGKLAGEGGAAPAADAYGSELGDPFAPGVSTKSLEKAFRATMLPVEKPPSPSISPYNDGTRALCCMVQRSNSLRALLALVLSAARQLVVCDELTGQTRYASGSEAIDQLGAAAQDGRNSDPLIVERITRFVSEGHRIAFDDPLGIYIGQVQLHELEQPGGEDVPAAWLEFSRGVGAAQSPDGRSRRQRLKLALPKDADFDLDDLVVRRSGERLRFGGQLAALVELAVYVRTGPVEEAPA